MPSGVKISGIPGSTLGSGPLQSTAGAYIDKQHSGGFLKGVGSKIEAQVERMLLNAFSGIKKALGVFEKSVTSATKTLDKLSSGGGGGQLLGETGISAGGSAGGGPIGGTGMMGSMIQGALMGFGYQAMNMIKDLTLKAATGGVTSRILDIDDKAQWKRMQMYGSGGMVNAWQEKRSGTWGYNLPGSMNALRTGGIQGWLMGTVKAPQYYDPYERMKWEASENFINTGEDFRKNIGELVSYGGMMDTSIEGLRRGLIPSLLSKVTGQDSSFFNQTYNLGRAYGKTDMGAMGMIGNMATISASFGGDRTTVLLQKIAEATQEFAEKGIKNLEGIGVLMSGYMARGATETEAAQIAGAAKGLFGTGANIQKIMLSKRLGRDLGLSYVESRGAMEALEMGVDRAEAEGKLPDKDINNARKILEFYNIEESAWLQKAANIAGEETRKTFSREALILAGDKITGIESGAYDRAAYLQGGDISATAVVPLIKTEEELTAAIKYLTEMIKLSTLGDREGIKALAGRGWTQYLQRVGAGQTGTSLTPFENPTATPTGGSDYGMRRDPFTGLWRMHTGIDQAMPVGTPQYSQMTGTVVSVGNIRGYGNQVGIKDDATGVVITTSHLSGIDVKVGDRVQDGTLIAKSGNTGRSTGPHRHIEAIKNGKKVDPKAFKELWPRTTPDKPADGRSAVQPSKEPDYTTPPWLQSLVDGIKKIAGSTDAMHKDGVGANKPWVGVEPAAPHISKPSKK